MGFLQAELEQRVVIVCLALAIFTCMATAVVKEEQVTSCNTPCDMLQLTCPASHRMAVREALFSVTTRPPSTPSPCGLTHTCGDETMCCEQSPTQDCVFSYSHSHLEAVHRNCSGTRTCYVKTERTQEETVACPFFKPEDTISHTVLDYVCINDTATVNICEATETKREGRTLFALLDSRRWIDPIGGAVCRCTAESVKWPTTNTIAVFVVDMRLNVLRQSQCSKADVVLKAGSTTRHLDCISSRDPRQSFPFIALLNHSNVATVELFLHSQLPEFVWIGFESNEQEDIRLSCGLQGYVPIVYEDEQKNEDKVPGGVKDTGEVRSGENKLPAGAMSGAIIGGILLCTVVVIVVVVLLLQRRRQRRSKADNYSEPHDFVDDMDVYYSTPDLNAAAVARHNRNMGNDGGGAKKGRNVVTKDDVDDGEVYVTAEIVRERKRQSEKKRVRIVSTPEISDDVAAYYASPWDIRDRRRMDEIGLGDVGEDEVFDNVPALPSKSDTPLPLTPDDECLEEDYAVLERNSKATNSQRKVAESYDRVTMSQGKTPHAQVEFSEKTDVEDYDDDCDAYSFVNDDRTEPDGCNQNAGFENDDDTPAVKVYVYGD